MNLADFSKIKDAVVFTHDYEDEFRQEVLKRPDTIDLKGIYFGGSTTAIVIFDNELGMFSDDQIIYIDSMEWLGWYEDLRHEFGIQDEERKEMLQDHGEMSYD